MTFIRLTKYILEKKDLCTDITNGVIYLTLCKYINLTVVFINIQVQKI